MWKDNMSQMSVQEDWIARYYAEMNPEKRQVILNENYAKKINADFYAKAKRLHTFAFLQRMKEQ